MACYVWCGSFLFVWEREKRAAVGTFLWSWYFLFCIRTCENRDRVAFQKGFCQSQHFFILFSILHFCLLLLQRVCHRKIWWCCWGTKTLADIHTHSNANTNTHPLTHRRIHQARITIWLSSETSNGLRRQNRSGGRGGFSFWPILKRNSKTAMTHSQGEFKKEKTKVVGRWDELFFKERVMGKGCFWLVTHFDLTQRQ